MTLKDNELSNKEIIIGIKSAIKVFPVGRYMRDIIAYRLERLEKENEELKKDNEKLIFEKDKVYNKIINDICNNTEEILKKVKNININNLEKTTNKDNNKEEYEKIVEKNEHLDITNDCYTDDDLSTIKEKYKLLKYKINNFLHNYINKDEKDNVNDIKDYIFKLFYNELYLKNTNSEENVFDTIIQNIKFLDNKDFNKIKNRLEKLINFANNFFISFNSVINKHKVNMLFDYFLEYKIYNNNIMYTDDNFNPQEINKCIYPAIMYSYDDDKNEYDVLEKALVKTD